MALVKTERMYDDINQATSNTQNTVSFHNHDGGARGTNGSSEISEDGKALRISSRGQDYWTSNGRYSSRHKHQNSFARSDQRSKEESKALIVAGNVDGKGEPLGNFYSTVIEKLKLVLGKHVSAGTMWRDVTQEVRYIIYREVQSMFKGGERLDSSWILKKARTVHAAAENRNMRVFYREHHRNRSPLFSHY